MDLNGYVDHLRAGLTDAAAAGGATMVDAAERLATSLDAAVRMALLEALSDAAAEITTKLDGSSVEVRLRGRDAELVVTDGAPAPTATAAPPPVTESGDMARITLRLPESLKELAERAAADEGLSVNAWLVRAIAAALQVGHWPPAPPGAPPPPPPPGGFFPGPGSMPPGGRGRRGRRMTGFAQA